MNPQYDVIIIGAGAAGMMCAIESGKRGRRVLLVDHAKKIAEKIRISGGGRCNFTNIYAGPDTYISNNPHFCKSALNQYTQHDFIEWVKQHNISFHEKKLGQLFCDGSAQAIIDMLIYESEQVGVVLCTDTQVEGIDNKNGQYQVKTDQGVQECESLVIATGGLSIPKIGATKFGYEIAKQFGLGIIAPRPGLVPLTFQGALVARCQELSGLSVDARVSCGKTSFAEGLLFTHRGLSGPSILQISSYWHEGEEIVINLAPDVDAAKYLKQSRQGKQDIQTIMAEIIPKRLAANICIAENIAGKISELSDKKLNVLAQAINAWRVVPAGTEGYRTAEVTLGGVDTDDLSSKTMEAKNQPGLFFIGEVVDVTGHLGGFNFQWAWSSGYVAGQYT